MAAPPAHRRAIDRVLQTLRIFATARAKYYWKKASATITIGGTTRGIPDLFAVSICGLTSTGFERGAALFGPSKHL